ncbi:hypothetical protein [Bradyrhizobium semiaridum]|uniref:hypothetical protein n=1 Tax=Bradyrhizobium semiaridum TaxID=2821404 RepID=UPI001CE2BFBD|nr:hypothetical protein [Bradyrhizobium semiaridum]
MRDGVVFRGANGPWKTGDYEFHLKAPAAKNLLALVLNTYAETHGSPPNELFIHGQTYFNDEEWNAFIEAAPKETNVIGVRIRSTGGQTKLFRDGDYPVLRGTALLLYDQTAYLWTMGYVPQLDTYIGPETPNPLHITVMKSNVRATAGESPRTQSLSTKDRLRDRCGYRQRLLKASAGPARTTARFLFGYTAAQCIRYSALVGRPPQSATHRSAGEQWWIYVNSRISASTASVAPGAA